MLAPYFHPKTPPPSTIYTHTLTPTPTPTRTRTRGPRPLQKLIDKAERKAERRRAKQSAGSSNIGGEGGGGADPDAEWLALNGLSALVEEELERETAHMRLRWARCR